MKQWSVTAAHVAWIVRVSQTACSVCVVLPCEVPLALVWTT